MPSGAPAALPLPSHWPALRFFAISQAHQIELVTSPPNITRHSTGRPVHSGPVPAAAESALIGSPAASPKAKHDDMMPEKTATQMPLRKSNSATAVAFCSG